MRLGLACIKRSIYSWELKKKVVKIKRTPAELITVWTDQGLQFRFYYFEISFFDQSLTFIILNFESKYIKFQTEKLFSYRFGNGKKIQLSGFSVRKVQPWDRCMHSAAINGASAAYKFCPTKASSSIAFAYPR